MAKYLLEMFAVSLLLTFAIEFPIAWCMGLRTQKHLVLVLLVNILTNPAAVLFHWLGIPQIPIELAVVVLEASIYLWYSNDEKWVIPHPVLLAVVTNTISWTVGVVIQWIGG